MPRRPREFVPAPDARVPDFSDPIAVRGLAAVTLLRRTLEEKYEADPWAFIGDAVLTLDQISGQTKPFPQHDYLRLVVREWQASPLLAIAKSRRMILTWLLVAVNYWLARYRPGSKIGFFARKQGEKETEGSNELVWRAKFIHDHLPDVLAPRPVDYSTGRLVFTDTLSEILALAQGPHQARQYTYTSVLCDEMAFWEQALETYVALRPTAEGGGKITCVSSAAPGFFEQIVFDRLPGGRVAA